MLLQLQAWIEKFQIAINQGDILTSVLVSAVITSIFVLVLLSLRFFFKRLNTRIALWQRSKLREFKIQDYVLLSSADLTKIWLNLWKFTNVLVYLLIFYIYLQFLFSFYPATKTIADRLYALLMESMWTLATGILNYIPKLLFLAVLFVLTRGILQLVHHFFIGIKKSDIDINGFYPEWADPTYKIARLFIIVFAIVIAFPYLPGADSPAFKGISIFLGVLLSLGSSGAIANIVSGVSLTYMRAFCEGDRVRIADAEGDVVEKTLFVTRVRTVKNVEITIPNLMVLNNHIINYSTQAEERGVVLHTAVTIGYDVPWARVHELLIAAALKTENVEQETEPYVLQKALDDFYVHYEINAVTSKPKLMSRTYSDLHRNILDSFNEAGIEIASPHLSELRDGNEGTLPDEYLPKNFNKKGFRVFPLPFDQG